MIETATQKNTGVDNTPPREKYWSELTETERIERLRTTIKGLQYSLEYVQSENIRLKNNFYKHSHSMEGKLIGPINEYDGSLSTGSCGLMAKVRGENPNEVYI